MQAVHLAYAAGEVGDQPEFVRIHPVQYRPPMRDTPVVPSLGSLFLGFFAIGICGFGGVLPWARRMVVEQRRWLTPAEFTELLGLCQFLPGRNIINLSVALGARFHGATGSVAAFAGLMSAPMAIVLVPRC